MSSSNAANALFKCTPAALRFATSSDPRRTPCVRQLARDSGVVVGMGSASSTGASVPFATTAPDFISFCQTYRAFFRSAAPRRSGTPASVRVRDFTHRGDSRRVGRIAEYPRHSRLGVLDAEAQILPVARVLLERRLIILSTSRFAAIANRMHAQRHDVIEAICAVSGKSGTAGGTRRCCPACLRRCSNHAPPNRRAIGRPLIARTVN